MRWLLTIGVGANRKLSLVDLVAPSILQDLVAVIEVLASFKYINIRRARF